MSGKGFPTSPLVAAIRNGNLPALIAALDAGADIEEANIHGHPGLPLRTACFSGNLAIVETLIQRGANINAKGADGSGMPLRLAVRSKNHAIIALLLRHGATIPAGVEISQESLAAASKPELPPLEMTPPANAPKAFLEPPAVPPIEEETRSPAATAFDIVENIDIPGSYGTDTNLLTMELLRLNETQETPTSAPEQEETKGGFWKSGRHAR